MDKRYNISSKESMTQDQNLVPSVSSNFVFDAELFRVTESKITYPNEKTVVHNDVLITSAVLVLPITERQEIYLVSQYRYLLKKNMLASITGNIENNQKPLYVAKKELEEKVGVQAEQWEEIAKVEVSQSVYRQRIYIFLAESLQIKHSQTEINESITIHKLSLENSVQKVFTGEIDHAPSMLGILMLDKLHRDGKL